MTDADDELGSYIAEQMRDSMTDAEELRRATRTLRDRAEQAWPGLWEAFGYSEVEEEWQVCVDHEDGLMYVANAENEETAAWIALVGPPLGPPLADLLEAAAWYLETGEGTMSSNISKRIDCMCHHALAVARVINRQTT